MPGRHLYPVLIDFDRLETDRATLMTNLRRRGVGTQVHYIPVPMHKAFGGRGDEHAIGNAWPGAKAYYDRVLSLPLHPGMSLDDPDRVADALDALLH